MFAHNKSGMVYQKKSRQLGAVINNEREPHWKPTPVTWRPILDVDCRTPPVWGASQRLVGQNTYPRGTQGQPLATASGATLKGTQCITSVGPAFATVCSPPSQPPPALAPPPHFRSEGGVPPLQMAA
jgi:hypothetical protein